MQVALAAFFVVSHRLGGRTIGSTSDSGSDYPGSSPGLPANFQKIPNSPTKLMNPYFQKMIPRELFHSFYASMGHPSQHQGLARRRRTITVIGASDPSLEGVTDEGAEALITVIVRRRRASP